MFVAFFTKIIIICLLLCLYSAFRGLTFFDLAFEFVFNKLAEDKASSSFYQQQLFILSILETKQKQENIVLDYNSIKDAV